MTHIEIIREAKNEKAHGVAYRVNGEFRESHSLAINPSWWDEVSDLSLLDDDIFLITYPRVGTTLTQTIITNLMGKPSKVVNESSATSFLEMFKEGYNGVEVTKGLERPRLIKTHLVMPLVPKEFFSKKPKTVFIVRNYFDNLVSCFHFYQRGEIFRLLHPELTFEKFFDNFVIKGEQVNGSWFRWHKLWLDYIMNEGSSHCILLHYQDIVQDKANVIDKLVKFLGLPASEELVQAAINASDFDNMKKVYDAAGPANFIREGKVDAGQSYFTEGQKNLFNEKVKQELGDYANLFRV